MNEEDQKNQEPGDEVEMPTDEDYMAALGPCGK